MAADEEDPFVSLQAQFAAHADDLDEDANQFLEDLAAQDVPGGAEEAVVAMDDAKVEEHLQETMYQEDVHNGFDATELKLQNMVLENAPFKQVYDFFVDSLLELEMYYAQLSTVLGPDHPYRIRGTHSDLGGVMHHITAYVQQAVKLKRGSVEKILQDFHTNFLDDLRDAMQKDPKFRLHRGEEPPRTPPMKGQRPEATEEGAQYDRVKEWLEANHGNLQGTFSAKEIFDLYGNIAGAGGGEANQIVAISRALKALTEDPELLQKADGSGQYAFSDKVRYSAAGDIQVPAGRALPPRDPQFDPHVTMGTRDLHKEQIQLLLQVRGMKRELRHDVSQNLLKFIGDFITQPASIFENHQYFHGLPNPSIVDQRDLQHFFMNVKKKDADELLAERVRDWDDLQVVLDLPPNTYPGVLNVSGLEKGQSGLLDWWVDTTFLPRNIRQNEYEVVRRLAPFLYEEESVYHLLDRTHLTPDDQKEENWDFTRLRIKEILKKYIEHRGFEDIWGRAGKIYRDEISKFGTLPGRLAFVNGGEFILRLQGEDAQDEKAGDISEAERPPDIDDVKEAGDQDEEPDHSEFVLPSQPVPKPALGQGEMESVQDRQRAFEDNIIHELEVWHDKMGGPGTFPIAPSEYASREEINDFLLIAIKHGKLELVKQTKGSEFLAVRLARPAEGVVADPSQPGEIMESENARKARQDRRAFERASKERQDRRAFERAYKELKNRPSQPGAPPIGPQLPEKFELQPGEIATPPHTPPRGLTPALILPFLDDDEEKEHGPVPAAPVGPQVGVAAHPVYPVAQRHAYIERSQDAFRRFREDNQHDARVVDIWNRNLQHQYYNWNDHLGILEPIIRNVNMMSPTHRPGEYIKKSYSLRHPTQHRTEKALRRENALHAFDHVHGEQANLGEYIDLKLVPRTLYIRIKIHVQRQALQILARRIVDHANEGDTRIVKQHNRKGKFSYNTWLSYKEMRTIDAQTLLDKLIKVTRDRTRTVTLIVRQKGVAKGNIHKLWETTFSLL